MTLEYLWELEQDDFDEQIISLTVDEMHEFITAGLHILDGPSLDEFLAIIHESIVAFETRGNDFGFEELQLYFAPKNNFETLAEIDLLLKTYKMAVAYFVALFFDSKYNLAEEFEPEKSKNKKNAKKVISL